jgi:two-component system, chemotaxis family, chemotaxis protein CheY
MARSLPDCDDSSFSIFCMTGTLDSIATLVVDDNRQMRLLLREVLRGLGIRKVEEAGDGIEALEVMRHAAIDLVLVDWAMQPLDGLEFTRLLRTSKDSPNPYCTIIMVSGHAHRARVREARDAGVNSFLVKPVSARSLSDHLHAAFRDVRPYVKAVAYAGPDRRRGVDTNFNGPFRRASDRSRPKSTSEGWG